MQSLEIASSGSASEEDCLCTRTCSTWRLLSVTRPTYAIIVVGSLRAAEMVRYGKVSTPMLTVLCRGRVLIAPSGFLRAPCPWLTAYERVPGQPTHAGELGRLASRRNWSGTRPFTVAVPCTRSPAPK